MTSKGKEFKFGNDTLAALVTGVTTLSNAVKVTLGPSGRNVLLNRPGQEPYLTKDGVTVAGEVFLTNPFEDMAAQLVKSVAANTAKAAGDGTTTATILTEALFVSGAKEIKEEVNVVQVKKGMDIACKAVVQHLKKNSIKCKTLKAMKNVATVSANGDKEIGSMVATAVHTVGTEGAVTVEPGSGLRDEVTVVEGYQFNHGYVSPYFITDKTKMVTEFDYPYLLFVDSKVSYIRDLVPILEKVVKEGHPIVIIAEDIDGDALTTLAVNHINGKMSAVAVKAPGMGAQRLDLLSDMAIFTKGSVVAKELERDLQKTELIHLGRAQKVVVTADTTTIISGAGLPETVTERINSIKNTETDDPRLLDFNETRATKLSGRVAVISVGGMTDVEMNERRDRIEDALFATQAAVEEGVLPGGGTALTKAAEALTTVQLEHRDQAIGIQIMYGALCAPLCQIANNAGLKGVDVLAKVRDNETYNFGYDCAKETYGDMIKFGILDPTKVTRTSIQNAVSVAGMLLTTQCMISETAKSKNERVERLQTMQQMLGDIQHEQEET